MNEHAGKFRRVPPRTWLAIAATVVFGVLAIITCNPRPLRASLRSAQLELNGVYCYNREMRLTLPVAWMQDVQLVSTEPRTFAGSWCNTSFPEPRRYGDGRSVEFGTIRILLDRPAPPYILVRVRSSSPGSPDAVLFSLDEERQTRELFDELRAEFEFRVRAPSSSRAQTPAADAAGPPL